MNGQIASISARLLELIEEKDIPQKKIFRAAKYALSSPGKRLRPYLTLLSAKCFGGNEELALDPACAIEMIHTYSLIHDDLPSMDNDDIRRGKPTLHKAFGEDIAILTGDFLLTYAFEILSRSKAPPILCLEMIRTLSFRIGAKGMIGGQVVDLESHGKKISEREILFMHEHKTSDLIVAALEIGAILSGASSHERELLSHFGRDLGISYQMMDDILDETSTLEQLGKAPGSDLRLEKCTSVTLYGLDKAREMAKIHHIRALSHLEKIERDTSSLRALTQKLLVRSY